MKKIFLSLCVTCLIFACSHNNYDLKGRAYQGQTSNGIPITIEFADNANKVGGKVVGNYFGYYEIIDKNIIDFAPLASTRMIGSPEAMEAEALYLEFLTNDANTYYIDNDYLIIEGMNGNSYTFKEIEIQTDEN